MHKNLRFPLFVTYPLFFFFLDKTNFFANLQGFNHGLAGNRPRALDFKRNAENRFGGKKRAVPWQVSVRFGKGGDGHICGGTILDEKTVLTAASCFEPFINMQLKGYFVKAGSPYRYNHTNENARV